MLLDLQNFIHFTFQIPQSELYLMMAKPDAEYRVHEVPPLVVADFVSVRLLHHSSGRPVRSAASDLLARETTGGEGEEGR